MQKCRIPRSRYRFASSTEEISARAGTPAARQQSFAGLVGGHNKSRLPGAGQEFLDHRNFHHGDDLRHRVDIESATAIVRQGVPPRSGAEGPSVLWRVGTHGAHAVTDVIGGARVGEQHALEARSHTSLRDKATMLPVDLDHGAEVVKLCRTTEVVELTQVI